MFASKGLLLMLFVSLLTLRVPLEHNGVDMCLNLKKPVFHFTEILQATRCCWMVQLVSTTNKCMAIAASMVLLKGTVG